MPTPRNRRFPGVYGLACGASTALLVAEVALACKNHCHAIAVRHTDGLVVANRAARLDDRRDPRLGRRLDAIWEGEVRVGCQHRAAPAVRRAIHRDLHAIDAAHLSP